MTAAVAAVALDLSHVGAAFGDPPLASQAAFRAALEARSASQ